MVFILMLLSCFKALDNMTKGNDLINSVREDDVEKVLALLQKGANPNISFENTFALSEACRIGNILIVSNLLRYNANPNVSSSSGLTPLMLACAFRNEQLVTLLIRYGAKVNTRQFDGRTALDHVQVSEGEERNSIRDILIRCGGEFSQEIVYQEKKSEKEIGDRVAAFNALIKIDFGKVKKGGFW